MDTKEAKLLGPDIGDHWYYISKGRAVKSLVGDRKYGEILDVGAGSGVFSRQLIDAGLCDSAVCVDNGYEKDYADNHHGHQIRFVRSIGHVDQKLILMLDVLEHVEDDVSLLRQYTTDLPKDARIIISVPAFQSLWSGHDTFLEHRRRYTEKTLWPVIDAAGLKIHRSRYFFGLLFPVFAGVRWLDRLTSGRKSVQAKSALKRYPPTVNTALTLIHDIERMTLFPINRVAGLTLFCVAGPA